MTFLRQLFRPSQEEVWQQLCIEIGGTYTKGGLWKGDKVTVRVKDWTVTLDTYTVSTGKSSTVFTRMRVPYANVDGFRFKVYRKNFFSNLGKVLGMDDIEVGYPDFDNDFIIKGNDTNKVITFFSNPEIRQLIQQQPKISFEVKDDEGWFGAQFPEGVDELYFQVNGVIKDVELLKNLFELFAKTLNYLCHIGSAYENDSNIEL